MGNANTKKPGKLKKNIFKATTIGSPNSTIFLIRSNITPTDSDTIVKAEIAKNKISRKSNENTGNKSSVLGMAFKMSTEFVAAVAVGTIIGFIFDNWFGTKPWLILIFFFVGVVAGIMNVIKSAKRMQIK